MFGIFDIAASGMEAQRIRLNTISSNLSNVNTTRGSNGDPYRRRDVVFSSAPSFDDTLSASSGGHGATIGVKISGVIEDSKPFKVVYEPGHPDAGSNGYLKLPNVNVVEEMVNMISAMRAYEANVTAFKTSKDMLSRSLEIGG